MLSRCEGAGTSTSALFDDLPSETDDSDFNPQDAEELAALHMDQQADAEMEGLEVTGPFEAGEGVFEVRNGDTRLYLAIGPASEGDSGFAGEEEVGEEEDGEDNESDDADDDGDATMIPVGMMQQITAILSRRSLRLGGLYGAPTIGCRSHPRAYNCVRDYVPVSTEGEPRPFSHAVCRHATLFGFSLSVAFCAS